MLTDSADSLFCSTKNVHDLDVNKHITVHFITEYKLVTISVFIWFNIHPLPHDLVLFQCPSGKLQFIDLILWEFFFVVASPTTIERAQTFAILPV